MFTTYLYVCKLECSAIGNFLTGPSKPYNQLKAVFFSERQSTSYIWGDAEEIHWGSPRIQPIKILRIIITLSHKIIQLTRHKCKWTKCGLRHYQVCEGDHLFGTDIKNNWKVYCHLFFFILWIHEDFLLKKGIDFDQQQIGKCFCYAKISWSLSLRPWNVVCVKKFLCHNNKRLFHVSTETYECT